MKNTQSGRSMIEMLGVLGIIGVLSVGGLSGFGNIMTKQKSNQAYEQILIISNKLIQANSSSSSYSGLNNCAAIKFNAIPDDAVLTKDNNNVNCKLINPFKGEIIITSSKLSADNDAQAFSIIYTELSRTECTQLAANDFGANNQSSFVGVHISANNITNYNVPSLYLGCSNNNTPGNITFCANNNSHQNVLPMDTIAKGCSCTGKKCSFAVKYF